MSLVHRRSTPNMRAASRANALKSTGPRSEQGKWRSTQNILKHLPFAQALKANMREMGENPEEYDELREAFHRAFQPQDDFEEMLVEDMAQARWRHQRLIRAESGLAASQRRKYEIERKLQKYDHGNPFERIASLAAVPKFGFSGLPDGIEKCEVMLKLLGQIRHGVSVRGFDKADTSLFQMAYGESVPADKAHLRVSYETCLKSVQSNEAGHEPEFRKRFLAEVDEEIAAYERQKELLTARDAETTPAMKDAQLLPDAYRLEAIARYEAGLERQFESKLRILMAWRSANRALLPDGAVVHSGPPPETVKSD